MELKKNYKFTRTHNKRLKLGQSNMFGKKLMSLEISTSK